MKKEAITTVLLALLLSGAAYAAEDDNKALQSLLKKHNFTGQIESTLESKLGRPIDTAKADLGRSMFFDKNIGLHKTNSCSGCHSPTTGFGDTQSIAIGIQNNDIVGPDRKGPRNQRRTPSIINTAFYPSLMWNGRFSSASGSPFDNSKGFVFPEPEGLWAFPAQDPRFKHLLAAQGHIPFTELPEMAGFTGASSTGIPFCQVILPKAAPSPMQVQKQGILSIKRTLFSTSGMPDFCQFDDGQGTSLPKKYPDSDYLNAPIRHAVLSEINHIGEYRSRFGSIYQSVKSGGAIEFWMIGEALAEFQISQTYANAPIDRFARGELTALSPQAKKGAIIFFSDKGGCVSCHAVSGKSNEMFSDFEMHNAGVPQISPKFGKGSGNVPFRDESGAQSTLGVLDLGLWEFTGEEQDKFKFRTSPLRNISTQPAFFHNGSFTRLRDAIVFHIDTANQYRLYDPSTAGVASDIKKPGGALDPTNKVLASLDPKLTKPLALTSSEIDYLAAFLGEGLLDPRAKADNLIKQVPSTLPSGAKPHTFQMP